jgi:hypothetical protein
VIDARENLTSLIRRAIEDEANFELATSPGRPTQRGGYDTSWMFAQDGTATPLTIEAAWYPASASFTLSGPAVDRADEAFWSARGLHRSQKNVNHGPLQCRLFIEYADGGRVDQLLGVLPALLAPYRQDAVPSGDFPDAVTLQLNSYKFDVNAVVTVNVRAETEDRARAMIDGLNSITTRTTGDDIEAAAGLDVSTSDYDVVTVDPRGRGYLVSAETQGGQEISVSSLELIPEPTLPDDLAGLREELAEADRALVGDSNDAEHDALHGLAETVRGLLDGSSHSRPGKSSPATRARAAQVDFPSDVNPAAPGGRGTAASPAPRAAAVTKGVRPS